MTDTLTTSQLGGLDVLQVTEVPEAVKILVYGDSGVGKTRLAGSASVVEGMAPVLLLDVEAGSLTLRSCYPDVDVIRITSMKDMQKVWEDLKKGTHEYRTVVVDSLSEVRLLSMQGIMRAAVAEDANVDPDIPQLRHWGKNSEQVRRCVRMFRDLPLNTIFTALVREERDRNNMPVLRPGLSGKLSGEVAGFLDIVLYMYVKRVDNEEQRLLLTQMVDGKMAKDRTGALPPVVQDPTMQAIWDAVRASA